jgi:hypothetical protein
MMIAFEVYNGAARVRLTLRQKMVIGSGVGREIKRKITAT